MPLNTFTVSTAVTPTVIETYFSHYLSRKELHEKPTAHISYHEGLHLIRKFLYHASHHTVEDIQGFTSQWVPCPSWVKVENVTIGEAHLNRSAELIQSQLGPHGVQKVGGRQWWQWRRGRSKLKAEWIEMKADYNQRKRLNDSGKRVMLYVHGGAYFFGSVDEHRYQMQRHARKLKARVFARMLVVLRDQGIPLPAGAILISPWVDLTHSFPSVAGDGDMDYIPAHGFLQRPSAAWPPPTSDDMLDIAESAIEKISGDKVAAQEPENAQGFTVHETNGNHETEMGNTRTTGQETRRPGTGHNLSIMLDGKLVEIKDQIQMYANNQLISHPLVSPVLQPSLGGLPPLLIMTGGGEMLKDEQIYLAHKAAHPAKYPPGDAILDAEPDARNTVRKYPGTDVQLQVWDDCCHVTPTLSFTRPAKFMYRSIAQFGAWALAHAQKTEIDILDDDDVSVISSASSEEDESFDDSLRKDSVENANHVQSAGRVGKAGDPLPPFKNHMIRQRVDRHGAVYPLASASSLAGLQLPANDIGVIKPGPVRKWMHAKQEWDHKYARQKRTVQRQRAKEMAAGYDTFGDDDVPPPSALAGRRRRDMPEEAKKKRSLGLSLWSLWGSSHDEKTIEREEKADRAPEITVAAPASDGTVQTHRQKQNASTSRSRSRRRTVVDAGQTTSGDNDLEVDENTPAAELLARKEGSRPKSGNLLSVVTNTRSSQRAEPQGDVDANGVLTPTNSQNRPQKGTVAYPFKLAHEGEVNASTMTLTSAAGVVTQNDAAPSSLRTPNDDQRSLMTQDSELKSLSGIGGENVTPTPSDVAVNALPESKDGINGLHPRPTPERFVTASDDVEKTV